MQRRMDQNTEIRRYFDFDTYRHGMRLLPSNKRVRIQEAMRRGEFPARAENVRTCFPRFLCARYFDGLFCIVNMLWPVVVERSELHGQRVGGARYGRRKVRSGLAGPKIRCTAETPPHRVWVIWHSVASRDRHRSPTPMNHM